jgi:GDPmannose 4,6-dehydratase
MKRIIIAGMTGQDGSLIYDYLKKKKFKILGLSRNSSKKKYIKQTDYSLKSLKKIIFQFKPDEIYNFAGLSKPDLSWKLPYENFNANLMITLSFLEVLRISRKKIKYFNASSSEIFKKDLIGKLNEDSQIFPCNLYGIAKAASHFLVSAYRKKYNLYLVNGIYFNHESYKNTEQYLLKYLLNSSKKIIKKKIKKIKILDSRPIRDFGCAKDYMMYTYKLMQVKKSDDYIIATGKSYSVKEIAKLFQKKFNLKNSQFKFINKINFKFLSKQKIANNKKLLKILNIKNIKLLPNLIETLVEDDKEKK